MARAGRHHTNSHQQAPSADQGDEGNQIAFSVHGKWQFNLMTKNYTAPGTYIVSMDTGDSSEYVFDPSCMTEFEVK